MICPFFDRETLSKYALPQRFVFSINLFPFLSFLLRRLYMFFVCCDWKGHTCHYVYVSKIFEYDLMRC